MEDNYLFWEQLANTNTSAAIKGNPNNWEATQSLSGLSENQANYSQATSMVTVITGKT